MTTHTIETFLKPGAKEKELARLIKEKCAEGFMPTAREDGTVVLTKKMERSKIIFKIKSSSDSLLKQFQQWQKA